MKPSGQWSSNLLKGLVIVSAVMTLIALAFLPASYHRDNSVHWPTASGVVSNVALKTYLQKPRRTYFSPFVCYNYTVEGIPRACTRIDFADSVQVFSKEEALEWLNRNYPVGKQVTVYYDPNNPDLAVLVPGAKDLILICWGSAWTAAFCCAASVVLLNRQKRKLHKTEPATVAPHRP
jgi:hypothetical protein